VACGQRFLMSGTAPGGPPLTRWPRAGQLRARKTAVPCTGLRDVQARLDLRALRCGPGLRRAGAFTKAEPGSSPSFLGLPRVFRTVY
jgi:hypothetical protein